MLNFHWLLNCPIWPDRLQMFVIGQVKSDSLDMKQPIKARIRAVNDQSCSNILLLTQLIDLSSLRVVTCVGLMKEQTYGENKIWPAVKQ